MYFLTEIRAIRGAMCHPFFKQLTYCDMDQSVRQNTNHLINSHIKYRQRGSWTHYVFSNICLFA